MSRNAFWIRTRLMLACLVGLPAAAASIGCGGGEEGPENTAPSEYQVADDTEGTPAPVEPGASPLDSDASTTTAVPAGDVPAPPAMPPLEGDETFSLDAIPDGETELLAYLEELQGWRPQAQSQLEFMTEVENMSQAKLAAADKLLALTEDPQTRVAAMQSKLEGMRTLAQLGDQQMTKELHGYCRTLVEDPNKEIAELGRLTLFGLAVDDLVQGKVTEVQPIVDELKARAAANPDSKDVFQVVSQAAGAIEQMGQTEAASEAYLAIYDAYKDSQDPELASQVRLLELFRKLNVLLSGDGEDPQPVLDDLASMLSTEAAGVEQLNMASRVAQTLEMAGRYEAAGKAFSAIEQAFTDADNTQLAEMAAARVANSKKRLALVGEPFVVEGVSKVDGTPFDWSQYQGKVVLIDFWATWCGPCLQELPNIEASYEKFRDKGFEVVGINLDEDLESLKRFLNYQPAKWTVVVSSDPNAQGFDNPMAVKCGIDAIPFMILVDRDGKVNAIHVRGEQLEEKLAELLGPVEEAAAEAETPVIPAPKLPTLPPDASPAGGEGETAEPALPIVPPENATPPADSAPPSTPAPQSSWSPQREGFFLSRSSSPRTILT